MHTVSTPSHQKYGKHLTQAEVNDLVKPTDDALDEVHAWLDSCGVDLSQLTYSPAKDWISVKLPVNEIERLLDTEYSVFQHEDGSELVRAPSWSLPSHLHEHIEVIQPTNSFFRPNARRRSPSSAARNIDIRGRTTSRPTALPKKSKDSLAQVCNTEAVTPACLRYLYGTVDYVAQVPGKNQMALNNYVNQTSDRSDVALFLSRYRPEAVAAAQKFAIEIVNGGLDQQGRLNESQVKAGANIEGNLDAELLLAMGYPTPLTAYNTGGKPPYKGDASQGPINVNEVCTPRDPPYLSNLN